MDKTGFRQLLRKYTLWFSIFAFFCVILFYAVNQKSMYTIADGIYQQYPYFMYTGKWIRMLFTNIFVGHRFELPMWDMTIGMGSDSLITFSSVANPLADPMYWISAFIPYRIAEYVFDAIVILKMYAAGLAFSYFAYCRKLSARSITAGAMVYVFSSAMYIGLTQASILNIFCLFPLLMAGVDRLWTGRGFKLYVIMLALCVINSYYFTYMTVLLVVFYCIVRFICGNDRSPAYFLRLFARFLGFSVIGAGIGIGLQLPAMMNLSGLDRFGIKWDTVIFSASQIRSYLLYAFSITNIGHEGFWGVSSVALLALVLLFSEKKKDTLLKALFIIYTLSFFFPVIGSVFNGFTFPTGRYVFGYIFLIAYIVASRYEMLFSLSRKALLALIGISVVYLLMTALFSDVNGVISGTSCLIMTGSLFVIGKLSLSDNRKYTAMMISVLITCILLSYAHIQNYLIGTEKEFGTGYEYLLNSNGLDLLSEEETAELSHTRYDFIPYVIDDVPLNSSMLLNINGYDFYNSNYNNDIDAYYNTLAVNSNSIGYMINGIRGRNFLELMNGTSIISRESSNSHTVLSPYSYEELRSDDRYSLYRASSDTSLVYFYDEAASSSLLETSDPIDIEEIMMNYCITDSSSFTPSAEPQHSMIDYEITDIRGIEQTGDHYSVQTGNYMTLSFDPIENSEISIYIEGIDADRYYVAVAALRSGEDICVVDTIEGQSNVNNMYYHNKNTFMINYGFVGQSVDSVTLIFLEGEYTIGDIKIYSRSPEQLDNTVSAFYDHADMNDVSYEIDGNHIHVTANADGDKYLYFAVPYSEGWSATVDGQRAAVEKANIGFMVIPVTQGKHSIELSYRTPYLTEGLIITFIFTAAFIAAVVISRKYPSHSPESHG